MALFLGYFLLRDSNWLGTAELHTLMETIATFLALFVGVMALVRFYNKKTSVYLFIGTGFLGTGLLDGYHTVVTSSFFAEHLPSGLPSLIPWSWIASRVYLSLFLSLSWLAWKREAMRGESGRIGERAIYVVAGILTLASFLFFAFVPLPQAYYPEIPFHRPEEFVPACFLAIALVGYWRKGGWKYDDFEHWLVLSLIVGFMGQAMFMSFSGQLFDMMFDAAHLLKKVSYIFVLTGLLISRYHLFRHADLNTQEIAQANEGLPMELTERKRAEKDLREVPDTLVIRLLERTAELVSANKQLKLELTERKRAEEALKESEERFRATFEAAPIGISLVNKKGRFLYANSRFQGLLGYTGDELKGMGFVDVTYPDDVAESRSKFKELVEGKQDLLNLEKRYLRKNGGFVWTNTRCVVLRNPTGEFQYGIAMVQDITEDKQLQEQLLQKAMYDGLTSLPNRNSLMARLASAADRRKRLGESYLFGVLFVDLDRFKNVNDSLGHDMGDKLLIAVSRRLEKCVRSEDTVARLGGDEFAILLVDMRDVSSATRVANRIQKALMSPFQLDEHEAFTTASIGIALSSTGYDPVQNLLRDADTAMYRAKVSGKARHVMFDAAMHARVVSILQLENDLRGAIERQEFHIHYQPIVLLETGAVIGFEALLRWQHPDRGLVLPAEFIQVTEETGLIVPIGRWALREACQQMHAWQARFPSTLPLYISVNITSKQFSQPELLQEIKQILRETGLDPRSLNLEMAESVIMENIESAIGMLTRLRDLKVRSCMDDFGTGYSSLNYLNRLPLDGLKIDLSFVSGTGVDLQNPDVVRTIMTLSRDLGKFVIAEGIETVEQLAQLRTLECKYGQGYLFSKPLDGTAAEKLIAAAATTDGIGSRTLTPIP